MDFTREEIIQIERALDDRISHIKLVIAHERDLISSGRLDDDQEYCFKEYLALNEERLLVLESVSDKVRSIGVLN